MKKIFFLFSIAIILSSCDPGFTEQITIRNRSGKTLPVRCILAYSQLDIDTLQFIFPNRRFIQNILIDSSTHSIVVTFDIPNGTACFLHDNGGLGTSFMTFDNGIQMLNMRFDTIIIPSLKSEKSIYEEKSWDIDNNSGAACTETKMECIINAKDVN